MVERRKNQRYPMPRGTFAILRNELDPLDNHAKMSIGEIAMVLYKSESEFMGQVTNLSLGGIAFDCDGSALPKIKDVQLDLLMAEKGLYLHNIPYATVPARSTGKGKKKTRTPRAKALRFKKLDAQQESQLMELMAHHVGSPSADGPDSPSQPKKAKA